MFLGGEDGHKANLKDVLLKIAKNPLIIGVVCGLIVLGVRSFIPVDPDGSLVFSLSGSMKFLYDAVNNLSRISSPLALVILGGLFDFAAVKGMLKEIIIGTASRVVVVPLVVIGLAVILSRYTGLISFDATVYPALVALFGSPWRSPAPSWPRKWITTASWRASWWSGPPSHPSSPLSWLFSS